MLLTKYAAMPTCFGPDTTDGVLTHFCSDKSEAGLKQCQRERQRSLGWSGKPAPGVFVPECDTDGEFKSTQCHESSGFCWCVDAGGNEIPRTRVRGRAVCRPSGKRFNYIVYARP